jgi:hypothetical protein
MHVVRPGMTRSKLNVLIGLALIAALSYAAFRIDRCSTVFTPTTILLPASTRDAPAAPPSVAAMHAVYPDVAADRVLNLGYQSFEYLTDSTLRVTPLPPHVAGRATVWVEFHQGEKVRLRSPNPRCGYPIVATVFKINAATPVYEGKVDQSPIFDAKNIDTSAGALLITARMVDGAENNWFCAVEITHEALSR